MRVTEFLVAYAEAFCMLDSGRIAGFYDLPLAVVRPDRTALVTTWDELMAHLDRIRTPYARAGMVRCRAADAEEVGFQESLGILNVSWELLDERDRLITSIDSTYLLRTRGGEIRIAAIVAHNEEERRHGFVARPPDGGSTSR